MVLIKRFWSHRGAEMYQTRLGFCLRAWCAAWILVGCCLRSTLAQEAPWLQKGIFQWRSSEPLLSANPQAEVPEVSLKDPSVVYHDGNWHLFVTHRLASGIVNMQYLKFSDWKEAARCERTTLALHDDQYHCAPQVFYYRPHGKWYLVYQLADKTRPVPFGPYYSTTSDIGDPKSWTKPKPMFERLPEGMQQPKWIDFWVICDQHLAHLFYTSNDGHFWRCDTDRAEFPMGWSKPEVALRDTREELFEASHTYKVKGTDSYLTLIEAIDGGRRYYKAWTAQRLQGPWKPLASQREKPFASRANASGAEPWTASISHGEMIRAGYDELLEVDPHSMRFVFQGAMEDQMRGVPYGKIPWKIGILELEKP